MLHIPAPTFRGVSLARPVFVYSSTVPLIGLTEIAPKIRELESLPAARPIAAIFFNWLLIATCFYAAVRIPVFAWPALVLIILSRQHALAVLMHDASHGLLHRNRKWNFWLASYLISYPMFFRLQMYQYDHLRHHAHLNTSEDPLWTSKQADSAWRFPKLSRGQFFLFLLRRALELRGLRLRWLLLRRDIREWPERCRSAPIQTAFVIFLYCFMIWFWTRMSMFGEFVWLWVIPLLLLHVLLSDLRSAAEHLGLSCVDDFTHSRNIICAPLERFLLFPYNVGLHLDHHLFPAVPCFNLGKLHALLMTLSDYRCRATLSVGYFEFRNERSVLNQLVSTSVRVLNRRR